MVGNCTNYATVNYVELSTKWYMHSVAQLFSTVLVSNAMNANFARSALDTVSEQKGFLIVPLPRRLCGRIIFHEEGGGAASQSWSATKKVTRNI